MTHMKLTHRPSILQDIQAERPMEIDAPYRALLEMARLADVPTPTLDLLVSLIKVKARARGRYPPPPSERSGSTTTPIV